MSCPIPKSEYPQVLLAHGGGGKLSHHLIEKMFLPAFDNPALDRRQDGAVLDLNGVRVAFSTDSYVVRPIFFPGGDIGQLAIHGTVNDLAMCGARPKYLSAGVILEEGFPMETLWRVVQSMRQAALNSGVQLVTGDTKVVDKGKGDGIYINTAGIGIVETPLTIAPSSVKPGDVILLNGDLGRHGIAIMAVREGLAFETTIESDTAPLGELVMQLLDAKIELHCLRDLTRGGMASGLIEIAEAAGLDMQIEETAIPVREDVRGACEILGFDPLYVANEGRMVLFVPESQADAALAVMRAHPHGREACVAGRVTQTGRGRVHLRSRIGALRVVDMLSGEQLPRIC
ncbi:MAG: hydrogenase expression/formation protein HypE [Verrucomicrobiota bacterium]